VIVEVGPSGGGTPAKYLCLVTYDTDMTAVRLGESARYGLRLYAYVLGTTVLGGAGVAAGSYLALPEVQAWQGPGQAEVATGAAGGVLLFLGLSVLVVGWLGTAYKLLADGVARGRQVAGGSEPATESEPASEETSVPGPDPNVATSETEPDADATVDGATDGADPPASEPVEAEAEQPPEPSPEEIAFGSSTEEGADESESVEEPEPSTASSGPLPGQNATSDPLADPGDE
jgi:hypothetical protein